MAMGEYLEERLNVFVWSGFYQRDEILAHLREDAQGEGEEFPPGELERIVDNELAIKREAEKGWPDRTDCDKLDDVFAQLRAVNLIALQNAGYTQSEGFQQCCDEYERLGGKASSVRGFCFYTFQDLERGVCGFDMDFGFGSNDGELETSLEVGRAIVSALTGQGFEVRWDQAVEQRPRITSLDWKRRGPVPMPEGLGKGIPARAANQWPSK